jgi:hypothetical protein
MTILSVPAKNSCVVRVGVSKGAGARSLFESRRPFSEKDTSSRFE